MKLALHIAGLILAFATLHVAHAGTTGDPNELVGGDTGYDLFLKCGNGQDPNRADRYIEAALCMGYLSGVWDMAITAGSVTGRRIVCPTATIQSGQLSLIYMNWARRNPQIIGGTTAYGSALGAFIATFP